MAGGKLGYPSSFFLLIGGILEYKTTPEHFKIFKKHCQEWIVKLGLVGWRTEYYHENIDGARARCTWNYEYHITTITLSTTTYIKPTKDGIKFSAKHEVLELLLADIREIGLKHNEDRKALDKEAHRIIYAIQYATE